jgi:hypothetical protein
MEAKENFAEEIAEILKTNLDFLFKLAPYPIVQRTDHTLAG